MHDTCTVLGSNVVTWNNTESVGRCINGLVTLLNHRLHPWIELCIVHANEVGTLILSNHAIRNHLVASLVLLKWELSAGRVEVRRQQWFCKYHGDRLTAVAVICLHCNIVNLWTYAECCIRWQCPRSSCPGEEIWSTPLCHLRLWIKHTELCHGCSILHVAVATRLVELV